MFFFPGTCWFQINFKCISADHDLSQGGARQWMGGLGLCSTKTYIQRERETDPKFEFKWMNSIYRPSEVSYDIAMTAPIFSARGS